MCFLGGHVIFDMFVCIVHAWAIIFDTFWQCGIESMCLAKSCDPNCPQNARKNPANARKNCQTRANPDFWSFRVIWVVLQRTHFWPCLKDTEFNRSHAHSVCLGLPIKQQGLQPRTEPLFWIDGFQMGQSWCPQPVSRKIALFSFYDLKSLRFSMKRLITLNA